MKRLLVILLTLSFVLLSSKEWVIISSFKLQQSEIAEKLCVNKFKKGSCCQGTCFLTGLLIDIHDEKDTPKVLMELDRLQLFFEEMKVSELGLVTSKLQRFMYEDGSCPSDYLFDLLDPPRISKA